MKYVWNIAKHEGSSFYDGKHHPTYRHYCRIERDYYSDEERKRFLEQLRLAFPVPEYDISLTRYTKVGEKIELPEEEQVKVEYNSKSELVMKLVEEIEDVKVSPTPIERKTYHDNGQLKEHYFLLNIELHGEYKRYHDNGQLREHGFFVDGKLHGEYKCYYKNGELHIHCFFLNGDYHGESKEYYENGQLDEQCFYLNDKDITTEVREQFSGELSEAHKLAIKIKWGIPCLP